MSTIKFHKDGPLVSSIGFGCMGINQSYPPFLSKEEGVKLIRQAYEMGYTFFDTAEVYGPFTNEELVGEALHDVRDKVFICTKFGFRYDGNKVGPVDSSPANIRRAIEGSLKRLRTNYIDLYYQHRVDPNTPIETVAEVMKELIKEGKIRYWGLSEANSETIRRAHAVCPVAALQSEYSMMFRDLEASIIPTLKELGIKLVAFSPLGKGLLTGSIKDSKFDKNDFRTTIPRFSEENIKNNLKLADYVQELAKKKNCEASQIAIAWVMAQGDFIIPIPGTKKLSRLKENFDSTKVKLTEEELAGIRKQLDQITITGERYAEYYLKLVEKDPK